MVLGHAQGRSAQRGRRRSPPRALGHTPFVAVLQPGIPVKPMTLFVNKSAIASPEHGTLTWGAAQAGVAGGVADAVADGIIAAADTDDLVLIAAVWVNPDARDAALVYANNRRGDQSGSERSRPFPS